MTRPGSAETASDGDVLTITITADTTRAQEAFTRAIEAAVRYRDALAPMLWQISLSRQRRRSRLVTRNKQRRSW